MLEIHLQEGKQDGMQELYGNQPPENGINGEIKKLIPFVANIHPRLSRQLQTRSTTDHIFLGDDSCMRNTGSMIQASITCLLIFKSRMTAPQNRTLQCTAQLRNLWKVGENGTPSVCMKRSKAMVWFWKVTSDKLDIRTSLRQGDALMCACSRSGIEFRVE